MEVSNMKCPYCSSEMKKGIVQAHDGIYWTPKKHWTPRFAQFSDEAIPIGTDDKLLPNSMAVAYNCLACKIVIIPYGEDEET